MQLAATNLNNLESKVYKLDFDKLVPVLVDLSKLRDVVKSDVAKKDLYNGKIKNIEDKPDITNLATNTTLNAKLNEVKKEIASITNLATTTALNAKINEFKNKTSNITKLATTATLTAVESKRPNVNNLVKNVTITQKLLKLKIKLLLIMIMIKTLLPKNLIS